MEGGSAVKDDRLDARKSKRVGSRPCAGHDGRDAGRDSHVVSHGGHCCHKSAGHGERAGKQDGLDAGSVRDMQVGIHCCRNNFELEGPQPEAGPGESESVELLE